MNNYEVVEYENNKYIVWDCKNYESMGSCCYERVYYLVPLKYITDNKYELLVKDELEARAKKVDITGKLTNPIKNIGAVKCRKYYDFKEPNYV